MASIAPLSKSQPFLENTQFTGLKRPQAPIFSVPVGRNHQSSKLSLRKSKMVVASSTAAAERPKKRYPGEAKGFVEEMRFVAMKLHTRDQAKEGEKEPEGQPMAKWEPSVEGYLKFLVDSKFVYDTLEKIVEKAPFPEFLVERRPVKGQVQHQVARVLLGRGLKGQVQHPAFRKCDGIRKQSCTFAASYSFWRSDAEFRNTGLERSDRLAKDLEWFRQQGHAIPEPSEPGLNYARILEELSQNDPQAFLCHFYNIYFAHSAGGRMIGRKVAEKILNKKELEFYKWDGDLSQLLQNVREKLNKVADSWTREQKDHCLEETEKSFKLSGDILRLILSS